MSDKTLEIVFYNARLIAGDDTLRLHESTDPYELNFDDIDIEELYETSCEHCNVDVEKIWSSIPDHKLPVSQTVMHSLTNLSAFSSNARKVLRSYDVLAHKDTLGSIAASVRLEKWVASGEHMQSFYPPRSRQNVLLRAIGIFMAATIIPFLATFLPCNPMCTDCTISRPDQMREMLPFSLALASLAILFAYIPGLVELRRARSQRILMKFDTR